MGHLFFLVLSCISNLGEVLSVCPFRRLGHLFQLPSRLCHLQAALSPKLEASMCQVTQYP